MQKIINWLKDICCPEKKGSYYMPVSQSRPLTRIEELPSGTRVFYIDVTDIPSDKVDDYITSVKDTLSSEGG